MQQTISSINSISDVARNQLPINGSISISSNNFELTLSRMKAIHSETNLTPRGAQIYVSNLCASLGLSTINCSNTTLIEQAI